MTKNKHIYIILQFLMLVFIVFVIVAKPVVQLCGELSFDDNIELAEDLDEEDSSPNEAEEDDSFEDEKNIFESIAFFHSKKMLNTHQFSWKTTPIIIAEREYEVIVPPPEYRL